MTKNPPEHTPKPKVFREKIGDTEHTLEEARFDVFDDVTLWAGNPRLQPYIGEGNIPSEDQLAANLQDSKGYDVLARSIVEIGQMEPIYVWKREGMPKYLVLEGATRVTILRDLSLKKKGTADETRFRSVVAKVLPEEFTEEERVILLARIHVRGTGVRAWGRYIEAKFIYDHVVGTSGKKPVTSVRDLARHMGKSDSWVSRLKDAYEFARKFVEHIDAEEGHKLAVKHFSTLEEISKATGFGSMVKDYTNAEHDKLREDVFEMVRHDVFKEYRDARFIRKFYDDPEKWAQLKTHEEHIANKLANEEKAGTSSLAGRIEALPAQIARAIDRDSASVDEGDLDSLQKAVRHVASHLGGVGLFRLQLREFTQALENSSLADVKSLTPDEWGRLKSGLQDFEERLDKHKTWK
jgi:hypothetical protein